MNKFYLATLLFFFAFIFTSLKTSAFTLDTISTVHPSCYRANDGSITVITTGATGAVTYSIDGGTWQSSPVFTGLTGAQYLIIAEDAAGNTEGLFVDLPDGPELQLNFAVTPTVCFGGLGGTITITPVNEITPFTIEHLQGGILLDTTITANTLDPIVITNLEYGPYTIMNITDPRGCINSTTPVYMVTVPPGDSLRPSMTVTAPSCSGSANGYISFDFNLGSGPYQVFTSSWPYTFYGEIMSNEQVGPLNPGTYSVQANDIVVGCTGIINFIIPDGDNPSTQITPSTASICSVGGSVSLTGSGASSLQGAQYSWSPSTGLNDASIANPIAAPSVTTTYTLTTTDANDLCASSATITIDVMNVDVPLVVLSNTVLSVSNPQAGAVYTWQQLIGNSWTDVGTGANYNGISGNEYRVKSSVGSCEAYSLKTIIRSVSISIYPNPSSDILMLNDLKPEDQWQALEIISSIGQRVLLLKNISNQTSLAVNIASLSSAVYVAKLTKADGGTVALKFVKR
ncbi:MAG: T9SS type A sorting domain-containing protein [Ferruginibacter sp.]